MTEKTNTPFTAIRAFVAIGRHGNFTRAAAALSITQSAVSRHVATLEAATLSAATQRGRVLTGRAPRYT